MSARTIVKAGPERTTNGKRKHVSVSPVSLSPNENAKLVADYFEQEIAPRFEHITPHVEKLFFDFAHLKTGETIMGYRLQDEWCMKYLKRTARAVRYMFEGGNKNRAKPHVEKLEPKLLSETTEQESKRQALVQRATELHPDFEVGKPLGKTIRGRLEASPAGKVHVDALPPAVQEKVLTQIESETVTTEVEEPAAVTTVTATPTGVPGETSTTTDTHYVVRRKSDGHYYSMAGSNGRIENFKPTTKNASWFDEDDVNGTTAPTISMLPFVASDERHRCEKKKATFDPNGYEWVKVVKVTTVTTTLTTSGTVTFPPDPPAEVEEEQS